LTGLKASQPLDKKKVEDKIEKNNKIYIKIPLDIVSYVVQV
jgi:hypothetical protein